MTEPKAVRIGVAWMILTTLLWVVMDTLNKHLSYDYPTLQVALTRFTLHTVLIVAISAPRLRALLTTAHWRLQLIRSAFLMTGTILVVLSLRVLPLLFVSAVMMLTPVIVTAISVPLLKEKVGWRRWAGVVAGFVGALVVVGPASVEVSLLVLLPLTLAVSNAFYQLITRKLGAHDSPHTTILYTGLVGTAAAAVVFVGVAAGAIPESAVWRPPDAMGWAWLGTLGVLGVVSHFCMILAYTAAPASVVAPFGYVGLVWAALFGFLAFGELPDWSTVLGALIISGSGLYIFQREQARTGRKHV